jgi:putative addiction module component (TIGR02574 family)
MLNYEAVLADATRLPIVDRIQLIEAIWDTMPADSLPPLSEEWIAEIRRRSAEYDSGTAQGVPWEQVKGDALRRAGIPVPDAPR